MADTEKPQTPIVQLKHPNSLNENRRMFRRLYGRRLPVQLMSTLKALSQEFGFSLANGEIRLLNNFWYVTHTGLVRLAQQRKCRGIHVETVDSLCDSAANRYVLKATVFPTKDSAGFVGYGDADPSNVSAQVRGAEMRIAETRAVNRALRKAYGLGICSVEELGSKSPSIPDPPTPDKRPPVSSKTDGKGNRSGHEVRDRLCQIIEQHQLDARLVKAYAFEFCGVDTLKDAPRELVEKFVEQLAERAERDRESLVCQLNSYLRPADSEEVA